MALPRRFTEIAPALVAVAIAALWPLSAYALDPLLLPALLAVAAAALVVLWKPEAGLALALALTPLVGLELPQADIGAVSIPAEPFRVLVPLLIFGVLLYSLLIGRTKSQSLPRLTLGIALLIAAALLSSFQAIDPERSVADVTLLLTAATLFLAVITICTERDQLLVIVAGAVVALLIASVHGIGQHFSGVFSSQGIAAGEGSAGRVQGSFGHPDDYAGFLALLIPLAAAVTTTKELPSRLRLLAGTAAVAAIPALIYSYARGATLTLIVGSLIWLAFLRPRVAVTVAVILALAVVALAPSTLRERFDPSSAEGDITLRADISQSSLDIYSQRPLLGVGVANFSDAYAELPSSEGAQKRLLHNDQLLVPTTSTGQYLTTLAEQGLVGFAALGFFFVLAIGTVYRACRARDPAVAGIALGIGMAVASLVLYSLTDATLQVNRVLVLFALLAVAANVERAFGPAPRAD